MPARPDDNSTRRRMVHWGIGLLLPLAACRSPTTPSVVLITVDTLRADHLGCYGYARETSPAIDRLASEGITFERAYAPMSTTLPSHISLMTGKPPSDHGVTGNFEHLQTALSTGTRLQTAAQIFKRHGYRTAAFISAAPVGKHTGLDAGFDVYDEPWGPQRRAGPTTDAATSWLSEQSASPFFLWVHYFDPHEPYEPWPPFDTQFRTDESLLAFLSQRGVASPSEELLTLNNLYDGEIRYLDTELARLLDQLEQTRTKHGMVIALTADHGQGLGQHDWLDHGRIYQEQLHIPLIVKLPKGSERAGERRRELVSIMDLTAGLVQAAGLTLAPAARQQLAGIDLLSGGGRSELFAERVDRAREWGSGRRYALFDLDWKYLHQPGGSDALYDLAQDPYELNNVIDHHPSRSASARTRIAAHLPVPARSSERPAAAPLPTEVRSALESLGYTE